MIPADDDIDQQAAQWVARLDAGSPSPTERREFDRWLNADSRHLGAFVRLRAQWSDLDRIGSLASAGATIKSQTVKAEATEPAAARSRWVALNRRRVLVAGIAGITALGTAGLALLPRAERYRTLVGEMRRIPLADGSMLILNTDTEAHVEYSQDRREVILSRGEAMFEVESDPGRPFIVYASDVRVRAVGTVFGVRLLAREVAVTVSEGVVELAHQAVPAAAPQRIRANHQSVVEAGSDVQGSSRVEVAPVAPAVVERRFAWLNGMVAFDGEPLGEAVAEVNRHSRRRILIDDAELERQPIVGMFRTTDAEGFCSTAAAALGATVEEHGDTIHLRMN